MSVEELIQEYAKLGFTLTELNGAAYVQKQKTIRDSQTISLPTLRNEGRDSSGRAQQSTP
jgi:hypothetical protein